MSATQTASTYLVLERSAQYWKGARIVEMRAKKPALKSGQIAVKVNLKIPTALFDQFIPVIEAEISEPDILVPTIEIESEVTE